MDFFSIAYVLFVAVALVLYYVLPKKCQPVMLLIANISFYLICGKWNIIYILVTALSVWVGARYMDGFSARYKEEKKDKSLSREDKKKLKNKYQGYKRIILWTVIALNIGILAYMKYFRVLAGFKGGLVLPLGISFYTFQAVSYLVDIYGEKYAAEKNFGRFLLFVSFFPQLIQGPINRYDKMGGQLKNEHSFDIVRTKKAVLLILFGLMKKYAIANMLADSIAQVADLTADMSVSGAVIVLTILMYSAQQYADFSGGIDVVLGVALLFDIEMMPNFRQPYFATSLGDFWRRWHISLGAWMRDYVFYPFALLKGTQNFGKWCGKHLGKHFGRVLPAAIANILVFFLVGIWHGAAAHYVWWGLYNGIVIALSDLLEPAFTRLSGLLHIDTQSKGMHVFRIIRTFIIVNIGWYFDRIEDMGRCFTFMKNTVTAFDLHRFGTDMRNIVLNPEVVSVHYVLGGMALAAVGVMVVFVISVLSEKNTDVFGSLSGSRKMGYEFVCLLFIFMILTSFVFMTSTGGFLYANF